MLATMKSLAVRNENNMIATVTLNNSVQDRDEPIRAFCARLRSQVMGRLLGNCGDVIRFGHPHVAILVSRLHVHSVSVLSL